MKSGIYLITNQANGKVYVGSSKDIEKRKYRHCHSLNNGKHTNCHLQGAWNTYGYGAFHFVTLEYCNPENLVEREDWWMGILDSRNSDKGYNLRTADRKKHSEETKVKLSIALIGKNLGRHHTAEAKAKISAAGKGRPPWHKGKKLPEEMKAKISAALQGKPAWNKGKQISEDTRAKISVAGKGNQHNLGYKHSEEARANMSTAKMGHLTSEETRAKIGAANKGKKHSQEARAKMSAAKVGYTPWNKGKKLSNISAKHSQQGKIEV